MRGFGRPGDLRDLNPIHLLASSMQLLLYHPHIHVSSSHHLSSARRPPLRTAPLHLNHPSPRCALSPPSPLHHRHCHPLSTRAGPPGLLHILPPDSSIYSSMSAPQPSSTPPAGDPARDQSITQYRKKFLEHRELEAKVKKSRRRTATAISSTLPLRAQHYHTGRVRAVSFPPPLPALTPLPSACVAQLVSSCVRW